MIEHEYKVGDEAFTFTAPCPEMREKLEREIKAHSVGLWLEACKTLGVSDIERRRQITEILARPFVIGIEHIDKLVEACMVDPTHEKVVSVLKHGNDAANRQEFSDLIAFLYEVR